MNSAFLVISLVLNASVLSAAIKCYHCIENNWNDCQQRQTKVTCNDPFPLGNSHCYSVSGKYDNGTAVRAVVARGCLDCKDKEKACEMFKLVLATVTHKPLTCDMACCTDDLCNTMIPPTTHHHLSLTTAGDQEELAFRVNSSAYHISIQLVHFIVAASLSLALGI